MTFLTTAALMGLTGLTACSDKVDDTATTAADDTGTSASADTDTGPPLEDQESLSSFTDGRFRSDTLLLLDTDEGLDLDGDGELDNSLPNVLATVNLLGLIDADLSLDGVNLTLAEAMKVGDIIQLVEAGQEGALLTVDLLLGAEDEAGALSVDAQSYDDAGAPTSRLQGAFSSETELTVRSGLIQIPFSFIPGDPPLFIPVEDATLIGTMDADGASGKLYGAIPVEDMMSQVIEPLIPTGDDYDPETYLNLERDEFLANIENLANKSMADIELEDGRMAVSAALSFSASAASW